jgi:hypothetical protein
MAFSFPKNFQFQLRCTACGIGKILDFLRYTTMCGANKDISVQKSVALNLALTNFKHHYSPTYHAWTKFEEVQFLLLNVLAQEVTWQVTITYWYWKGTGIATNKWKNVTNLNSFSCNWACKSNTLGNCTVYHVCVFIKSDLESDGHHLKK